MNKKDQKQTIIYCRSAVDGKNADDKLFLKEKQCRAYAALRNYDVIATFVDKGVSGMTTDRPGFRDLLAFMQNNPEFHGASLLVCDLADLGRNLADFNAIKQKLVETGTDLKIVAHDYANKEAS